MADRLILLFFNLYRTHHVTELTSGLAISDIIVRSDRDEYNMFQNGLSSQYTACFAGHMSFVYQT